VEARAAEKERRMHEREKEARAEVTMLLSIHTSLL
jgi:hypothetical protein